MTKKITFKDTPEVSRGITSPFSMKDECDHGQPFEEILKAFEYAKPKMNQEFKNMVVFGTGGSYEKEFNEWNNRTQEEKILLTKLRRSPSGYANVKALQKALK